MKRLALVFGLLLSLSCMAQTPRAALAYRADLVREAHFALGTAAPVPMFAAQIEQESGWRPGITAWDNGRGLAQFMDGTAADVSREFPELGSPAPYNPLWAIRALVRLDGSNFKHVAGDSSCEKWGAALKAYNAGLGYVLRAQKRSPTPEIWFAHTELINAGQSAKNFDYSRQYPRWILFKRQPHYQGWGPITC